MAIICGLWGIGLFITDSGPSTLFWVWRGDLLSSRLISVMLLTIAVGAAYSFRLADVAQLMLMTIVVYGLGLAFASLWNGLAGKPIPLVYLSVFGILAVISALLLRANKTA